MRVSEAVAEGAARLAAAGIPSPRVDAELLLAYVLGIGRTRLLLADDLSAQQRDRYRDLVARRAARVPLQHLIGRAPFRHIELRVGPGVFIPRPETEVMVDWALRWLRERPERRPGAEPLRVVDLCAGSGAIAAAIAAEGAEIGEIRVYAVEVDPEALRWLQQNADDAAAAGIARIIVVPGDATDPTTLADLDGTVDLVISNPPYVPAGNASALPPEVTEHDPAIAIFGGDDGLAVIRPLIRRAASLLRPGGAFAVEHDESHAQVVPALVTGDGRFAGVELHHDLAGRPRFTTAMRASGAAAADPTHQPGAETDSAGAARAGSGPP